MCLRDGYGNGDWEWMKMGIRAANCGMIAGYGLAVVEVGYVRDGAYLPYLAEESNISCRTCLVVGIVLGRVSPLKEGSAAATKKK